jgi:hypothetical protein
MHNCGTSEYMKDPVKKVQLGVLVEGFIFTHFKKITAI